MSMKNPLTPAGIKPATFRFVAQRLKHCATGVRNITVVQERKSYVGRIQRQASTVCPSLAKVGHSSLRKRQPTPTLHHWRSF